MAMERKMMRKWTVVVMAMMMMVVMMVMMIVRLYQPFWLYQLCAAASAFLAVSALDGCISLFSCTS